MYRSERTITQYNDELNWINDTRTRNLFQGGLLRRQIFDNWEGHVFGEWLTAESTDFAYASDGTLASQTHFAMADTALAPVARTLYDSQNGVFLSIVEQEYQGGEWANLTRESFTISNDFIVGGLSEFWAGTWLPVERFGLEEVQGDVIEVVQAFEDGHWTNTERRIYEDLTIEYLYLIFEQLTADFLDYTGLWYGLRVPDVIEQEWADVSWVNVARTSTETFIDFQTGAKIQEIITAEDWIAEQWAPFTQVDVLYTRLPLTAGLPASTTVRTYEEGEWLDTFVERYIIKDDIRRIVQATVEMDLGEGFAEVTRVLIDWVAIGGSAVDPDEVPARFELAQNTPNPFNPSTRIQYRLDDGQEIRLAVFDMLGRQIAVLDAGLRQSGEHTVHWDASDAPSGTYLYRLETAAGSAGKSMVLLK